MMGIGPRGLFTSLHSPALSTWGVGSGKWECARCPYHVCIRPSRPITSGKLYWSVGEDGGELTDDRLVEGRVIARDTRLGGWVPV